MTATIRIDGREITAAFARMRGLVSDLTPAMREIGEVLTQSTIDRFKTSTAPDGGRWAPNKPSTLARKRGTRPLIGETGLLSSQFAPRAGPRYVEISTPMEYAATHQYGARRGQYGRSRRGAPIPWGDIPARPFLGLSESDRRAVMEIIEEHCGAVDLSA